MIQQQKYQQYQNLLEDLRNMIDTKGRGYVSAQAMNDEFWEQLGTHRDRLQEQINVINEVPNDQLSAELAMADSIYDAARLYISKYK